MSYSVQLYSIRTALAEDAAGTLDRLAAIGFTQVEPFDFAARADVLEPALAQAGLSAPSGHAGLVTGDREQIFDAAERLGIGTVIEPFVGPDNWQDHDSVARTADALNLAAESAEQARAARRLPQPPLRARVDDRRHHRARALRHPARPRRGAGGRHLLGGDRRGRSGGAAGAAR